ncbi:MAG: FkbM family methyltransferase [Acidobacteriota bacterium]
MCLPIWVRWWWGPSRSRPAAATAAVRDGDVALDIGTNFGWHSLHLARHAAVRRVYAFEPSSRTLDLFRRSVEANALGASIDARRVALGREVGDATLKTFSALDSAHASIYPLADLEFEEESVLVVPLDDLIPELVASPAIVKCDVEGSEMDVLLGAVGLLAGRFGPPPIWFLEANYETSGMAGYFPWQLIETAREQADYGGYTLRDGRVVPMSHPRALRHGDTLILATPEAHAERFG